MRRLPAILCFCVWAASFAAQTTAAQTVSADRITSQEIPDILARISGNAGRVNPMLEQLRIADWISKGASDTYDTQWKSTRAQFASIQVDMTDLTARPEQLTDVLKALFRVQTAHRMLSSLMGGLRKYQNPALADLIESVAAENRANEERLQQYVLELASEREQQLDVMNLEAQRCRGVLSRQPAEPVRRTNSPPVATPNSQPASQTKPSPK